jgi:hypothetical protein
VSYKGYIALSAEKLLLLKLLVMLNQVYFFYDILLKIQIVFNSVLKTAANIALVCSVKLG